MNTLMPPPFASFAPARPNRARSHISRSRAASEHAARRFFVDSEKDLKY
jgi:hypothetical protein